MRKPTEEELRKLELFRKINREMIYNDKKTFFGRLNLFLSGAEHTLNMGNLAVECFLESTIEDLKEQLEEVTSDENEQVKER